MAPNALQVLSMEVLEATEVSPMSHEPCNLRRSSLNGRLSVSPSLLHSRSSPPPSFRKAPFNTIEKSQSYYGGPYVRNYSQFRVQKSHPFPIPNHAPIVNSANRNRYPPKRRTQSESLPVVPVRATRQELRVDATPLPSKPCHSISKTAVFHSKSAPSKLPATALTCAELEAAAVVKARPKLLTCAELEALQAQNTDLCSILGIKERSESFVTPSGKEKSESQMTPLTGKEKLESTVTPSSGKEKPGVPLGTPSIEKVKPESRVTVLGEDNKSKSLIPLLNEGSKPKSPITGLANETKCSVESISEVNSNIWTPEQLFSALNANQMSVPRCQSVSSEISTLDELVSRSSTPFNLCSSPVSSASSGYESSSECCDSSSKFTVSDDSALDLSADETDSVFDKNSVKRSLLSVFSAVDALDYQVKPTLDSTLLADAVKSEATMKLDQQLPTAIKGPHAERVAEVSEADVTSKKRSSKRSSKKKSLRNQPSPVDLEVNTAHFLGKNVSACGSSKKGRKVVSAALPPSPSTVMPPLTCPPGALQLPSPPKAWRNDAVASTERRVSVQSCDIASEIKLQSGVSLYTSGHAATGSPIVVC